MGRIDRVNELMRREISIMLQKDLQDPRLEFVTITHVDVSRDLRYAKVSFSVLGPTDRVQKAQEALEKASGFVRKLVGERIRMRYTPEIHFIYDRSIEYSAQIDAALENLKKELD